MSMTMRSDKKPAEHDIYKSMSLHLSALLLSEIPSSNFTIENPSLPRKTFIIKYPKEYEKSVNTLVESYTSKSAMCNLFLYNAHLFRLRNALRSRQ